MKLYKLKWLLYFLAYRLNRWLGGTTKWERRDAQASSKMSWEACMALMRLRALRRQLGYALLPVVLRIINDFADEVKNLKRKKN